MINPEEIEIKSKEFNINISNVQRDYVLSWFLWAIFTGTDLKDKLFLKGGNALRKCYFPETRYSGDIDFGTPEDLPKEFIKIEFNKACDLVQQKIGVVFDTSRTRVEEKFKALLAEDASKIRIFEAQIYFKEFHSGTDRIILKIEMDVTRFDRTILPIQQKNLIHPYSDSSELSHLLIPVMKAEEIFATKLKCLLQREHAPDLFDVVYPEIFAPGFDLNKKELVATFLQKTIFEHSPYVVKEILLETPFEFFRQYWKDIICSKQSTVDVEVAINKFIELINDLFQEYSGSTFDNDRFFGSKLRNPILKAARTQTILEITYDGYSRKVEPYSLKYMEPRGKMAREYLYVWNIVGGSQSEPGLRMFLPHKIQEIKNTEEKFSPRYLVDLFKAGEPVTDPYLYDPSKTKISGLRSREISMPKPRRATRFQKTGFTSKTKIKCGVCNKIFYKSTFNMRLNKHKDRYGFNCLGTFGYQVF